MPKLTGVELIQIERQRQMAGEGYTPEHDATHISGQLSIQAAALAVWHTDAAVVDDEERVLDPWGLAGKHSGDRIRSLVIAGALLAAEIDRLLARNEHNKDASARVHPGYAGHADGNENSRL